MATTDTDPATDQRRDALVERLFGATLGAMDLLTVYLGDRLGLYRALADHGPTTVEKLAAATGAHERYVREWLEQQAVAGILDVDDASANPADRRYALPPAHAEVLLDPDSLNHMAPMARFLVGIGTTLPALLDAFRSGGGVPYADYGVDVLEGQEGFSRPLFVNLLGSDWLPRIPAVHARLLANPPARVADVACGAGRSSIAIARAYPNVRVDGLDLDEPSIALAQGNLAGTGLDDRVSFMVRDAADPQLAGRYDLVTVFEAIHDMSQPVEVLQALRALVADGGAVLVADERVADAFAAPGDEIERLYYGFSVLHCLPAGMAEQPSVGTGTVMRAATMRDYALTAGFRDVEILPIENDFWRFYPLLI